MIDVSESLILLKSNERCERIAQVPHWKWAIVSELLRSLTNNEQMSEFFFERIFGQKKSDLLGNQMSEFPALDFAGKLE